MSKLITEVLSLSKLALPVALSQLAIIGMGTTDVLLVGRASTGELAALSLGNNIWNIGGIRRIDSRNISITS